MARARTRGEDRRGTVMWHVTMSLDGFIAGPGDAVDWVFEHSAPSAMAEQVVAGAGALLVGRRSYYLGRAEDHAPQAGTPYGGAWQGPQLVLMSDPPDPAEDEAVTFHAGPLAGAVAAALEAAGDADVVVIGATLARGCIEEGLLDEMAVHIAPILLGDGVPLFDRAGIGPASLELLEGSAAGPLADLRYRVLR